MLDKVQNHAMQVKKSSDIVILSIKAVMMSWAREVAKEKILCRGENMHRFLKEEQQNANKSTE